MRGTDERASAPAGYVDLEARVRADHPLRVIRGIANVALASMSGELAGLYAATGRPSVAPEKLLRAMLLQAFYGIRSERQLTERLDSDLLFRWFVGLGVNEAVFDHSIFSKNRDRLLTSEVARRFLAAVLAQKRVKKLLSSEHFSVDGTLIDAWASMKSFRPKDHPDEPPAAGGGRNAEVNFHGERRSNATHASTTDPDAKLFRKGRGQPSRLCYIGHALMENRSGLVVAGTLGQASGTAEREAALSLLDRHVRARRSTLGADKAYDVRGFVADCRVRAVTPHVAQNAYIAKNGCPRPSAIDGRTTRHIGYELSQRARKRVEEVFGWLKAQAGMTKTRFCGRARVEAAFAFALLAYDLIRLPKLLGQPA